MAVKLLKGGTKKKSPKFKADFAELKLPTGKSKPSDSLLDYSMLLFGRKKIGKTTFAAQYEGALFLMCEPGGKALSIRQVSVKNWLEFKAYVALAIEDAQTRTIIVDTADFAYEYCMDYVCERDCMTHPSDEGYGKGWKAVRKEFVGPIKDLLHSGKGVVFISHSKDDEFKTRKAETFNKTVSSMPGQAKDVLEGLVDIWANYDYSGDKRILIIGGNEEVDAGHRIEGRFQDSNGNPINTIQMGKTPAEGYKNFVAAFENRAKADAQSPLKKRLVIKGGK